MSSNVNGFISSSKFISFISLHQIMQTRARTICAVLIILCISGFGFHINLKTNTKIPNPLPKIEFWTSSNYLDRCISNETESCGNFIRFMRDFKAETLSGYTWFMPHYFTWRCTEESITSRECSSRCIGRGRYCNWEFINNSYYEGKDVVIENLRQACFFKFANEIGNPWLWWDYVNMFGYRCSMKKMKFNKQCADRVIRSIDSRLDIKKIDECMGNPDADVDHSILKFDQELQIGEGSSGPITILPTLVLNHRQYRGKLETRAVLKLIGGGLKKTKYQTGTTIGSEISGLKL